MKRKNRGTRTRKALAFMCSVIELEIALYSNLMANFYSPPLHSFTAFTAFSLIFVSPLPLSLPCSLVSLCTWKRQACLVPGYEYLSPVYLLQFMPGFLRARPLVCLLFSSPSQPFVCPSPTPWLIICLLIPTRCILYDPLLLPDCTLFPFPWFWSSLHGSVCFLVILKPFFFRHRCLYVCICDYVHVSMPSRQCLRVLLVWQQRPQVWGRYWKRILLSQVKLGTA